MSLIIEVSLNGTKTIACYAVRRITNTDKTKPVGTTNTYEIRKSNLIDSWGKSIGKFEHNYDDPVEKIVELAMKKIQEGKKE
jgi:hypothetical protein